MAQVLSPLIFESLPAREPQEAKVSKESFWENVQTFREFSDLRGFRGEKARETLQMSQVEPDHPNKFLRDFVLNEALQNTNLYKWKHVITFENQQHISHQKNPHVRKIFVRNSRAGNGCTYFMGASNFCVLPAGKPSMSIKSSF